MGCGNSKYFNDDAVDEGDVVDEIEKKSEEEIEEEANKVVNAIDAAESIDRSMTAKRLAEVIADQSRIQNGTQSSTNSFSTPEKSRSLSTDSESTPVSSKIQPVDVKESSENSPLEYASAEFSKRKEKISSEDEKEIEKDFSTEFKKPGGKCTQFTSRKGFFPEFNIGLSNAVSYGNHLKLSNTLVFVCLIFLMNVVIAGTRSLEYSIFKGTLLLTKSSAFQTLLFDSNIVMGFLRYFVAGFLKVFKAEGRYEVAFQAAKIKFLRNADNWFVDILQDRGMRAKVKDFLDQLNLFVFNNFKGGKMLGLSSITGEYVYVRANLDMMEMVRVIQHEMVHSFFRFYRRQQLMLDPLMLSPAEFSLLKYKGEPIHSGYLYDYVFSRRPMISPVSPFSILCSEDEMT